MKNKLKYILVVMGLIAVSCDNSLDPITQVDASADATAPAITITAPINGAQIKVFEAVTAFDIKFKVTDDVEVANIVVKLDGSNIATFNDFTDYRIVAREFAQDGLTDGEHQLDVIATDIEGKSTTSSVSFTKAPPYEALFEGEKFYMPFDGDYRDQISFGKAEQVGTPGFAGDSKAGADAYTGATDSYLTFPVADLIGSAFSGAFWYKVNATPDRAGILVVGDDETDRNQGFRIFREGSATEQRIKMNIGTGNGDSWNDGGVIDVTAGEWVHVAFSITPTKATIFFNGMEVNTKELTEPIDWTGCELLTIGAGGPTFSYWNHLSDLSIIDELRLFNKELTATDVQLMINSLNPYVSAFDGESFYMPFDGDLIDLVGSKAGAQVGATTFSDNAQAGSSALMGATDSYVTYPSKGLTTAEFSATMWYKVNPAPDRAGILVIGDDETDRNQGFRLFREGSAEEQRIKMNVGLGTGESWNDGGVINATTGDWVHIAMTISSNKSTIYINGSEVNSADLSAPIDWTGVGDFVIASGGPTFNYWGHNSDLSSVDELRFFSKALSTDEIALIYGGEVTAKNFGSTLFLPFEGDYTDANANLTPTIEGTPSLSDTAKNGTKAYQGAEDSYLSFPVEGLVADQFSGAFWYKVNNDPDRAGILIVGPPMDGDENVRTSGFRVFREADGENQRIKLHVGTPEGDVWNDGEIIAAANQDWVHVAFTVSDSTTQIYLNGEPVDNSGDMTDKNISWENCTSLSVGSGAPNFIGWNHKSDTSLIDDLYLFNKLLTQEEIQEIMNN